MRCAYSALVGTPDGKRPLEKPGRKWEQNNKTFDREARTGFMWLRIGTGGGSW
jgi:hypothetical protein